MSLTTFFKKIGVGLKDFGEWVEKGLPAAGSVLEIVDPPLTPIISAAESLFGDLATKKVTVSTQEAEDITKALALIHAVQTVAAGGGKVAQSGVISSNLSSN